MPAEEGAQGERAHLMDLVRRRVEHQSSRRDTRETGDAHDTVDLSAADIDAFNRAVSTVNAGRSEDAWKLLAPIIEHTRARKVGSSTWLRISELAFATGALTQADEAAGRAGKSAAAQKLVADVESTRHRIALPLDAAKLGVPSEREPAYVAGFYETAKLISESDGAAARARLGELATAFPDAPGIDVLKCDIELRAKHVAVGGQTLRGGAREVQGRDARPLLPRPDRGARASRGGRRTAPAPGDTARSRPTRPAGARWPGSIARPARASGWRTWPTSTRRCLSSPLPE